VSRDRTSTQRPTPHARRLVRAVDVAALGLLLAAALISDSLTLAGVVVAGAIMALREAWLVFVPRRLGEQGLGHYQYGFGKILQAGNLVLAALAVAAGLWLAGDVFSRILTGEGGLFPLGLALAASANALALAWNGVVVYAHHDPADRARRALRQVRRRLLASLAAVQVLLTVAALAKDLEVAVWVDSLGAILISLLIVVGGVKLAWECICDLIDHPLDRDQERAMVAALVQAGVEPEELVDLRTRRCAGQVFVELTLHMGDTLPIEAVRQRLVALRRALEAEVADLDLVIKLQGAAT